MTALVIPSPPISVVWLGPIPLRAYGILMVSAITLAGWITWRRYRSLGGDGDAALDAMMWAVPMGLVGARLYHVATHWSDYFGPGATENPFKVWEGGMAIFGAVIFGALGAVIGLRRAGQRVGPFADAVAPALLVAQGLGRLGNYFNQELFGAATSSALGLEVDDKHLLAMGLDPGTLVQPLFLYEAAWNLTMAVILTVIGNRARLKSGQLMALYMVVYGLGRVLMETMRLDTPGRLLGLRVNMFTAVLFILLGVVIFFVCQRVGASRRVSPSEVQRYLDLLAKRRRDRAAKMSHGAGKDDTNQTELDRAR